MNSRILSIMVITLLLNCATGCRSSAILPLDAEIRGDVTIPFDDEPDIHLLDSATFAVVLRTDRDQHRIELFDLSLNRRWSSPVTSEMINATTGARVWLYRAGGPGLAPNIATALPSG